MKFDASKPVDPSNRNSVQIVTPITFALIQRDLLTGANSSRPIPAMAALIGKPKPYRIGRHDVLSIIVWDRPELVMPNLTYDIERTNGAMPGSAGMASQSVPGYVVDENGQLQFPYVKGLRAEGLSERELQSIATRELTRAITDPQVTVRVVGYRSQKAYVEGEVRTPGVKAITDVPATLAEMLNQADGIAPTGDRSRIQLTRGEKTYDIDLTELHAKGLSTTAIAIKDGDVIRMPLLEHRVVVMGEVGKPSPVPFRNDGRLTLSDALGDAAA